MRKTLISISVAFAFASAMAVSAIAQPQGPGPGFKPQDRPFPSVAEMAQRKADMMQEELALTDKQYKKVLKLYKTQIQKERDLMEENKPEGMPAFPGGGPGMGGGPQGGFPGSGFPGGGPGMGGGRPPMGPPMMRSNDEEMEKLYDQEDKKLKKILSEEQYATWRSVHPKPQVPLPDIEL